MYGIAYIIDSSKVLFNINIIENRHKKFVVRSFCGCICRASRIYVLHFLMCCYCLQGSIDHRRWADINLKSFACIYRFLSVVYYSNDIVKFFVIVSLKILRVSAIGIIVGFYRFTNLISRLKALSLNVV